MNGYVDIDDVNQIFLCEIRILKFDEWLFFL